MKTTNIFLVHGPLVLAIVKRLLETDTNLRKDNNYCFIFFKDELDIVLPNCQTISYATSGVLRYIKAQINYKNHIKKILRDNATVDVFLANPFHFATNHALFLPNRDKAFLLEDGLANYYDARIRRIDRYKMLSKAVLGLLIGLPYKLYSGHITAYDSVEYSSIYVFNKKLLFTNPGHISIVPGFAPGETDLSPEKHTSVVVLDQDIESLLTREDSIKAREALYAYLRRLSCEKIYYKKHPSQEASHFYELQKEFPNTLFIDSTLPFEMLIGDINPIEVVSFISSALITICDSYPYIKCTSIGYNLFSNISGNLLEELFLSRNINITPA